MKTHALALSLALSSAFLATAASAADPVAEAAKLSAVPKTGDKQEARAERKAEIKDARAAGELPSNEWNRNNNAAAPKEGTRESRKAERQQTRAEVKQQAKAGELPQASDEWASNRNAKPKLDGTHETRKAERQDKRAEMRDLNRQGAIPKTTEATVSAPQ